MENQEQTKTAGKTQHDSDLRTFLIAFLTSVILIALYHFGTGIYAIWSGASSFCSIPVTREYVLVPVSSFPMQRGGGMMMPSGPRRGFGRQGAMPPGAGQFNRPQGAGPQMPRHPGAGHAHHEGGGVPAEMPAPAPAPAPAAE